MSISEPSDKSRRGTVSSEGPPLEFKKSTSANNRRLSDSQGNTFACGKLKCRFANIFYEHECTT